MEYRLFEDIHGAFVGGAGQAVDRDLVEDRGGEGDDFREAQGFAAEAVLHDRTDRGGAPEPDRCIFGGLGQADDGADGEIVGGADAAGAAEGEAVGVDSAVSDGERALVAVDDHSAAEFFPERSLGGFSGAGGGGEEDRFGGEADDGGVDGQGVVVEEGIGEVDGGPEDLRADGVGHFGDEGADGGAGGADFALDGDEGDFAGAVAEDAGVRLAGEDDLTVREGERLSGGDFEGRGGEEGEGDGVRCGLGGEEEGVAVFDEGAIGQKAHGHAGDAVVVRHEAVLYGKCAHTMGRAGANSPGVLGGFRKRRLL